MLIEINENFLEKVVGGGNVSVYPTACYQRVVR